MIKTVGLFADVSNLYYCIGKKYPDHKLDYNKYIIAATSGDNLFKAYAYGTEIKDEATGFKACLKSFGYTPRYKKPRFNELKNEYRNFDWNVGIALDVTRLVNRVHTIILGSSDPDLVPLIEWIHQNGAECHIYACGISKELKEITDYWTEVTEVLLEDPIKINTAQIDVESFMKS